ncbi:MAG: PD-(D/E)XK nuclease family protein [Coriobacteriales bacterium]|nr:PD-(D/E)XK nuclease family protein [Coriobacteriales bacterium]
MSLTIQTTTDEHLAGKTVQRLVGKLARSGNVLLLAPSFAEVLQVQTTLADSGFSLGVEVATPRSWVRDRWDVWGDGRRMADGPARTLLMSQVLRQAPERDVLALGQTPGTIRLLCSLAEHGLPWMQDALRKHAEALTPAEVRAASLLPAYEELLHKNGLVEYATCACTLPQVLAESEVAIPPVALVGFSELARADRELVLELALRTDVTLVIRTGAASYGGQAQTMAQQVEHDARKRGVEVRHASQESQDDLGEKSGARRNAELERLLHALFRVQGAVSPTGAVRLLKSSGPLAEAELVARELEALASDELGEAVVVVPDVRRAWRELAPKLVARGLTVRANLSVPVLHTESGRAFMGYVRTVAQLVELGKSWPAPREGVDGTYVQVGNMDWWPPRELADFLLSDIAHVEPAKARALDISWRTDRLLSPADVLAQLQSAKATSGPVERATRELLRGRMGSAASKLLAPYVESGSGATLDASARLTSLAYEEATAVLASFLSVASTLKELGITADPSVESCVSLYELASMVELALGATSVALRPQAHATTECGCVLLVGRGAAASMPPGSFDVAVLCGLTSTDFAVPAGDGELEGMLGDLCIEGEPDALASQRTLFFKLCALPRRRLLLERPLFLADSHETYEAVMLTELLSCYEQEPPSVGLAEDDARANLSAAGGAPSSLASEVVAPAGCIDDSLRRLVTVPQEGRAELPGGLPVLSASQLESYLECPLKWFSLRRLRLGDNDAGFGPLEMGTFAHRVLELTYAQLFLEGAARLDAQDAKGMQHAREVLNAQFAAHREHQHMRSGSHPAYQALIPHGAQDEAAMDRLHRDLLSTLDYTAERLVGFEPKAFEWEFGRGRVKEDQNGLPAVAYAEYAGVRVTGTVDRIDINGQGQVVIIDYKHKGPTGFFAEYSSLARNNAAGDGAFVLPRRIQALLYAQVVRRAFADLRIVGALYLGTRGSHELAGAVDEAQANAIYGGTLGSRRANQVVVDQQETFGQDGERGMNALLDATEQAIAQKVQRLREGHIEADPIDAAACAFCPVANCERRLS